MERAASPCRSCTCSATSSILNSVRAMNSTISAPATFSITVTTTAGRCGTKRTASSTSSAGAICATRRSTARSSSTALKPVAPAATPNRATPRVSTSCTSSCTTQASSSNPASPKAACAQGCDNDKASNSKTMVSVMCVRAGVRRMDIGRCCRRTVTP